MPRVRLGVALLLPEPAAREVDGLRRGCGDGALERVPPHLTLVPPVNVREVDLPRALAVLRRAACGAHRTEVELGPPESFLPANPTVYLAVGGDEKEVAAVHRLRGEVFRTPLERQLTWPFVPHVTIADELDRARIPLVVQGLVDFRLSVAFDRIHLLAEQHHGESHRRWVPVADYRFEPRRVVARGGFALELTISELVDPEARRFEQEAWPSSDDQPERWALGTRGLVVVARREREGVVGVARGWVRPEAAGLDSVLVGESVRGQGIGRHLEAAFWDAAGR